MHDYIYDTQSLQSKNHDIYSLHFVPIPGPFVKLPCDDWGCGSLSWLSKKNTDSKRPQKIRLLQDSGGGKIKGFDGVGVEWEKLSFCHTVITVLAISQV